MSVNTHNNSHSIYICITLNCKLLNSSTTEDAYGESEFVVARNLNLDVQKNLLRVTQSREYQCILFNQDGQFKKYGKRQLSLCWKSFT